MRHFIFPLFLAIFVSMAASAALALTPQYSGAQKAASPRPQLIPSSCTVKLITPGVAEAVQEELAPSLESLDIIDVLTKQWHLNTQHRVDCMIRGLQISITAPDNQTIGDSIISLNNMLGLSYGLTESLQELAGGDKRIEYSFGPLFPAVAFRFEACAENLEKFCNIHLEEHLLDGAVSGVASYARGGGFWFSPTGPGFDDSTINAIMNGILPGMVFNSIADQLPAGFQDGGTFFAMFAHLMATDRDMWLLLLQMIHNGDIDGIIEMLEDYEQFIDDQNNPYTNDEFEGPPLPHQSPDDPV